MGKIKEDLIAGYQAFQTEADKKLYSKLGRGQSPRVMVIGCADSRVDPLKIFNANPGDIFVTRNVANIVPPSNCCLLYTSPSPRDQRGSRMPSSA